MPAGALKGGKSAGSPAKGGSGRAAGARPKVASGRNRKQSPKATNKGSPPQTRRRSGKSKLVPPSAALAEEPSKEAQPGLGLRGKLEAAHSNGQQQPGKGAGGGREAQTVNPVGLGLQRTEAQRGGAKSMEPKGGDNGRGMEAHEGQGGMGEGKGKEEVDVDALMTPGKDEEAELMKEMVGDFNGEDTQGQQPKKGGGGLEAQAASQVGLGLQRAEAPSDRGESKKPSGEDFARFSRRELGIEVQLIGPPPPGAGP